MNPIRKSAFLLGLSARLEDILGRIGKRFTVDEIFEKQGVKHFFDTFDWRLYRKKIYFYVSDDTFTLKRFDGQVIASTSGKVAEKLFWWDINDEEFSQKIRKHIAMRALCPTISLSFTTRQFKILNKDRKTIAWLTLFAAESQSGDAAMELPELLIIQGVRGYEKPFDKVIKALSGLDFEYIDNSEHLLERAYGISERLPLDYGAKFAIDLQNDCTVGVAVSKICLNLLESMKTNFDGVYRDIDSEFLHDFRIAVRRTRSLLSLLKKYLPKDTLIHFEAEFKWLGSITGPLRDIDVYLLKKEEFVHVLPATLRGGLNPFFDDLALKRKKERKALQKHLVSQRYRNLTNSWYHFLTDASSELFTGKGEQLCLPVVNKIIQKRFTRLIKEGNCIDDNSANEQLHKLRIKGKKFRYLLEFFKSFYGSQEITAFLGHMKKLQDNLGDFNDLSVQTTLLENRLEELRSRNKQTIRFAAALGSLITYLRTEHVAVRARFGNTYRAFNTEENRNLIAVMTAGGGPSLSKE